MPNQLKNEPVWGESQVDPALRLTGDIKADVCIVGAGIAGMSTAYQLSREGVSVVVLDDGRVGGGQTGRTTAHLASVLDDRFAQLEKIRGVDVVRLAANSHSAAIDCIEATVERERIACDFERVDGYLFSDPETDDDVLNHELDTLRRAGLSAVEPMLRAPIGSFDTGPCLRFPRQGQFSPLKYLRGLVEATQRNGGRIYTRSHAETIEGGDIARVILQNGPQVTCRAVVVATNVPINDLVAIHTKQAAYLTYVIAARIPSDTVTRALFWDTQDPYHYVRLQRSSDDLGAHDLLIVGGEDHKTGQADDGPERYARLEAWARERFPMMDRIVHRWSGQVMETMDGLAFIGRNPLDSGNVYVATGDSGMGITHGTIAGLLLTDLIQGRVNEWQELYDPSRRPLRGIAGFVGETLNMAAQYKDWFTGGEVESAAQIGRDSGAVIRKGLTKVAVYRDRQGRLHEFSATCPHLGCIVHWNTTEKLWDCPCHGSRFAADGHVINGPANCGLQPVASQVLASR